MLDPPSSPHSDEPAPGSSSPTVVSTAAVAPPSRLPLGIAAIGLCGVLGYTLARLTLPPQDAAIECVQSALAARGAVADSSLDVELVMAGKLEVGGRRSSEIANGPLSDPVRRKAIESCRAVYAKQTGVSAEAPLLRVDTATVPIRVRRTLAQGNAARDEVQYPEAGAQVSVQSVAGPASCVTSSAGQCELTLRHLAHDAKLTIVAQLTNGVTVSKATTVLELLQAGLTLEAVERAPPPPPDCLAAGRSVEDAAQYTKVPADAAGHELEARVEVMSSGIVSDVQPADGSDPKAMAALRLQLAGLRGLPGPCSNLSVSLHY
jgi:hypothetical protein